MDNNVKEKKDSKIVESIKINSSASVGAKQKSKPLPLGTIDEYRMMPDASIKRSQRVIIEARGSKRLPDGTTIALGATGKSKNHPNKE